MTERLHFHFSLSCIGEGNGSPLQCSCLENPRDGGAWWVAVSGVAQSRTRLKRLSSSSSLRPLGKNVHTKAWWRIEVLGDVWLRSEGSEADSVDCGRKKVLSVGCCLGRWESAWWVVGLAGCLFLGSPVFSVCSTGGSLLSKSGLPHLALRQSPRMWEGGSVPRWDNMLHDDAHGWANLEGAEDFWGQESKEHFTNVPSVQSFRTQLSK